MCSSRLGRSSSCPAGTAKCAQGRWSPPSAPGAPRSRRRGSPICAPRCGGRGGCVLATRSGEAAARHSSRRSRRSPECARGARQGHLPLLRPAHRRLPLQLRSVVGRGAPGGPVARHPARRAPGIGRGRARALQGPARTPVGNRGCAAQESRGGARRCRNEAAPRPSLLLASLARRPCRRSSQPAHRAAPHSAAPMR